VKLSKIGSGKCSVENSHARRAFKNLVSRGVDMVEWEKLQSTVENEDILTRRMNITITYGLSG